MSKTSKIGKPGPGFGPDPRIRIIRGEVRRPNGPKVVKTIAGWAEHEHVTAQEYMAEAVRLGYPIKSVSTAVPKHWHDDIKITFREARRG